eukprot:COSAG02_NODE_83_length_39665_cov_25.213719_24_plen_417_part_00
MRAAVVAPLLGLVGLLGLLGLASSQPEQRFPGANWERVVPEEVGMSSELLEAAMNYAGGLGGGGSRCVSVHRHGYLVAERYYEGTASSRHITWSTSKAIAATLIGAAQRRGQLQPSDPASVWIPEWQDNEAANVTIDMLLRHDSGRYYDPISDFVIPQLVGFNGSKPATQTEFAVSRPQAHPPGTVDQYNQMAFQALEPVIRRATLSDSIQDFTERELFAPIEMQDAPFWEERGAFTQFIFPETNGIRNGPLIYGGVRTSCRDLARFGQLWLHRGNWGSGTTPHQVFTQGFYEMAMMPNPRASGNRRYHWGVNGNMHRANGMGDQLVAFDDVDDLVITRTGDAVSLEGLVFSASEFVNRVVAAVVDRKGRYNVTADRLDEVAGEGSVHRPAAEKPAVEWLQEQVAAVRTAVATPVL